MLHELKTWPQYFSEVLSGNKQFEVRKDDRGFKVGDEVLLKEFYPDGASWDSSIKGYTGRILHRRIDYVLRGEQFGIIKGYVVLSLSNI